MKKNYNVILLLMLAVFTMQSCTEENEQISLEESVNSTQIVVKNTNDTDTVLVYLTLGKKTGFKANVNGIFGIKNDINHLQGSFYLAPKDSVVYADPKGVPIQGNISFLVAPDNCVPVTLYEFCLNNEGTILNAQETVDISCMSGVNTYGSIDIIGGGNFTDNYKNSNVRSIKNQNIYKNNNISGVYPFGCPYCVNNKDMPSCITNPSIPNEHNICQIQRNSKSNGGIIRINYIGKTN